MWNRVKGLGHGHRDETQPSMNSLHLIGIYKCAFCALVCRDRDGNDCVERGIKGPKARPPHEAHSGEEMQVQRVDACSLPTSKVA